MSVKKLNNVFRKDFDLVLIDAVTGEEYSEDGVEIRSGSSLIVKRVPVEVASSAIRVVLTDFWIRLWPVQLQ
ncbi:DWNN domain-containing protein [Tanacetum coccineum]